MPNNSSYNPKAPFFVELGGEKDLLFLQIGALTSAAVKDNVHINAVVILI